MQVTRKAVTAALYSILKGAYAWQTADPRLMLPDDLAANQQPALFLVKTKERVDQSNFAMPKYLLSYYALILVRAAGVPEDLTNTAETRLDDILDAVDTALQAPRRGEPQTLGGLVTNCWIDGEITIDTPVLFEQCSIWLPISVQVGM